MYSGVPMITPVPVTPRVWSDRAMPKSMILALPSLSIMTFWGLRSRWTTPRRWASARPSAICLASPTALASVRWPDRRMKLLRSSPGTYSMEMKIESHSSPRSYIRQT